MIGWPALRTSSARSRYKPCPSQETMRGRASTTTQAEVQTQAEIHTEAEHQGARRRSRRAAYARSVLALDALGAALGLPVDALFEMFSLEMAKAKRQLKGKRLRMTIAERLRPWIKRYQERQLCIQTSSCPFSHRAHASLAHMSGSTDAPQRRRKPRRLWQSRMNKSRASGQTAASTIWGTSISQ